MKTTRSIRSLMRTVLVPSLIVAASQAAFAANDSKTMPAANTMNKPMATANDGKMMASPHFLRASKLMGMNVRGADGKNIGEISDMIVNLSTGDVRYAVFEYDPSIMKAEKVFAVPVQDMDLSADGKFVTYKSMARDQLDRASMDKKDWQRSLANREIFEDIDRTYGYQGNMKNARLVRASDVVGMDVNGRDGKDIGDIKELVIDMAAGKVRYAVLEFDPGWFKSEKLYAFPLSSFSARQDDDELMLNVDKQKLSTMKSFDSKSWDTVNGEQLAQMNRTR